MPLSNPYSRAAPGGGADAQFAAWRFEGIAIARIMAFVIDSIIVTVLIVLLGIVASILTVVTFGLFGFLFAALSFGLLLVLYAAFLIGGPESATLGMRAMRIEVRRTDGGRPGFVQAACFVILFYVLHVATSWLLLLFGLFNERRRLVHDFICGTVVLRTDRAPGG